MVIYDLLLPHTDTVRNDPAMWIVYTLISSFYFTFVVIVVVAFGVRYSFSYLTIFFFSVLIAPDLFPLSSNFRSLCFIFSTQTIE